MRRSVFSALATVSLTALVTVATSSHGMSPSSLGTLKQLDKWKVGIVDPEGQSFCAMVNKFDKNFGLAFALSPEGYGSVAVDVTDAKFTPGDVYQVALKTNGSKAGTYPGRATSERSVVVQVGQNKAFYDALKSNAALGVGLPALNVEFSLNKFAQSYGQLIDCSQSLVGNISSPGKMPAVRVKDVEKASLAPLDRELAEISGDDYEGANVTDDAKDKDALFDAVEAKAESNDAAARTQLASLDQQRQHVTAEIGAQKQKSAEIAEEKQQVERKLIASTKPSSSAVPAAASTGATAKLWDSQQGSQAQSPEQQILWDDAEKTSAAKIETVEAEKSAAAAKQVDDYSRGKQQLDEKAAAVKQEAAKIETSKAAAPADKALKASLVAKQAELARISAERVQQTNELTRKLSTTQGEYEAKLAAIAAERDALKANLAAVQKSATDAQKSAIEAQKTVTTAQQDAAVARKTAADAQATAQASAARATALQGQLELALEQKTAAQKTGAEKGKAEEKLASVQAQLDKSQADKKALETRLAAAEKQSAETAARAAKMETATGSDSKQLIAIKASLADEKASHDKQTAELRRQINLQNTQFEELKATYIKLHDRSKQASASADKSLSERQKQLTEELASRDNYVAQLETKLAVLESERAAATSRATKAQEDVATVRREMQGLRKSLIIVNDDDKPAADLAAKKHAAALAASETEVNKAEAELKEAHTRISTLESQLDTTREQVTELQKSAAKMTTVAADAQVQSDKTQSKNLEQAQAEIARLKANTAELEGRLFNATTAGKDTAPQKLAIAENNQKLAAAEAEIERLKSDNLALSGKLVQKAQQARIAPVTPPDELAARDLATQRGDAELAQARDKLAQLEKELEVTRRTPQVIAGISAAEKTAAPQPSLRASPIHSSDEMVSTDEEFSPVVSAPIPSRKPAKGRKLAAKEAPEVDVTRQITAREFSARNVASIEPAAGDMAAPTISRGFFEGRNTPARSGAEPVVRLKRVPVAPVEATSLPAPIVTRTIGATPVVAKAFVATPVVKDPAFDENRAAAFLDRIMSHHRPAGAKPAARRFDASPVFAVPQKTARRTVMTTVNTTPDALSRIETAAGAPSMPTLRSAPVMQPVMQPIMRQDDDAEFPARVTATPLYDAPVKAVRATAAVRSGSSSIETVLANAGINDAEFTGGDSGNRQWTTGGLSGMYEHTATHGRSFGENAQGYIERYRDDCRALKLNMGPVQKSGSGSVGRADISCPTPGNTYTTAMVFWQDGGSFNAVLHSGFPDDGAQVKGLADNVATVVGGGNAAPAFSPRGAVRKADAIVTPSADRQYRFNIRQDDTASAATYQPATYQPAASFGTQYGQPADFGQSDFETVVIE